MSMKEAKRPRWVVRSWLGGSPSSNYFGLLGKKKHLTASDFQFSNSLWEKHRGHLPLFLLMFSLHTGHRIAQRVLPWGSLHNNSMELFMSVTRCQVVTVSAMTCQVFCSAFFNKKRDNK
jgi:hypothetical protein